MKMILTVREITDMGLWDEFCTRRGINPWAKNTGLVSSHEEFSFNLKECEELQLISRLKYLQSN